MTDRTQQRMRWSWRGLVLAAMTVWTGCTHTHLRGYQANHPRSLQELYFEATADRANYAENSVNPYPGEVVSPPDPLAPSFPPPPLPVMPVGQVAPISSDTGVIRRVSATSLDAGGVQTAQHIQSGLSGGSPRVSEIFEDTDVREAIQALSTQAGISVVVDEQIGGVTSAIIEDEPFEQALRKVLLPLGLVYSFHDGQYLIGLPDPESALFPMIAETYEFRPQHLAPGELLPLLPERLQGYVRIIEKRNLMLVEAPHETAVRIVEQLQQSDQPVGQVLLEAIVCVFNPNQKFNFNADMRQSLNLNGEDVLDIGSLGLALTGFVTPIGIEKAFSDFAKTSVFLRLLAQEGYVTIRAAPRVMAKDGEKATISISRETYFALYPQDVTTNNIFFPQNVQKVDAGIVLDIVPVIRGDTVTVTIEKAEVSEDIRKLDQTNTNLTSDFPLINRRQVSTTVHVKDGQTIVIGGLMQRQTVDRLSHVPYLHGIPLLGKLFERIDQEEETAEVAIFISPRIIRPAVMPVACPPGAPPPAVLQYADPMPAPNGPMLMPPAGTPVPMQPAYMPPVNTQPVPPSQTPPPVLSVPPTEPRPAPPMDQNSGNHAPPAAAPAPGTDSIQTLPQAQLRFVLPKPAISTSTPAPTP